MYTCKKTRKPNLANQHCGEDMFGNLLSRSDSNSTVVTRSYIESLQNISNLPVYKGFEISINTFIP